MADRSGGAHLLLHVGRLAKLRGQGGIRQFWKPYGGGGLKLHK